MFDTSGVTPVQRYFSSVVVVVVICLNTPDYLKQNVGEYEMLESLRNPKWTTKTYLLLLLFFIFMHSLRMVFACMHCAELIASWSL